MSTNSDHTFIHYSPYIRLTKDESNNYTLWIVTYIPQNFTIPSSPAVSSPSPELVQVNVNVESGGATPDATWEAVSFKVPLPTPSDSGASVNTTVLLDDPEDEGSSKIPFDEAEEE